MHNPVVNHQISTEPRKFELVKSDSIVINDNGCKHFLNLDDIIMLEASSNYCIIHTHEIKFTTSKTLKYWTKKLEVFPVFFRIHRSYFINTNHIKSYTSGSGKILMTNDLIAYCSRSYKSAFKTFINDLIP